MNNPRRNLHPSITRGGAGAVLGAALLALGLVFARANEPRRLPEVREGDLPAGYLSVDPGIASSIFRALQTDRNARVRRLRWTKGALTLVVDMVAFSTAERLQTYLRDGPRSSPAWHLQPADEPIRARVLSRGTEPMVASARVALPRICIYVLSHCRGRHGDGVADPRLVERLTAALRDRAKASGD